MESKVDIVISEGKHHQEDQGRRRSDVFFSQAIADVCGKKQQADRSDDKGTGKLRPLSAVETELVRVMNTTTLCDMWESILVDITKVRGVRYKRNHKGKHAEGCDDEHPEEVVLMGDEDEIEGCQHDRREDGGGNPTNDIRDMLLEKVPWWPSDCNMALTKKALRSFTRGLVVWSLLRVCLFVCLQICLQ